MEKHNGLLITLSCFLLLLTSIGAIAKGLNAPQLAIQKTSNLIYNAAKENSERLGDRDYALILVNDILEPQLDLEKISRLVLGKHWRKASDEQKIAFQREFKTLLVNTYASSFNEFSEWTVHFLPMSLEPEVKRTLVKTEVIQPSRPPVAVNYRMAITKEGIWKTYDVMIEGISMVTNYRSSFAKSIRESGGLDNVIQMLAEKNQLFESSQLALDDSNPQS